MTQIVVTRLRCAGRLCAASFTPSRAGTPSAVRAEAAEHGWVHEPRTHQHQSRDLCPACARRP